MHVRGGTEAAEQFRLRLADQQDAARALGLHTLRLNRICNGLIDPDVAEQERIAQILEADRGWLFSDNVRIPAFRPAPETTSVTAARVEVSR